MRTAFMLVLSAGLVGLPAALVSAAPDDKPALKKHNEKPVVVPFERLKSGHVAIQIKVNDKGPFRVIFDTGAPMNLVTTKLAKETGILDDKVKGGGGPFGARGQFVMKTVEIGDVKVEKMTATVMDHPTLMAIAEKLGPLEGIIGFPFFSRYRMTIDYQKSEMTLVPNGFVPGDAMEELQNKLIELQQRKGAPTMVGSAGLWGMVVGKDKTDEDPGVVVEQVMAGGAAAAGGLKAGDRLLTLDGRWTDTVGDTYVAASLVKPGREVEVVVRRDGKELKLRVKPGRGT
jgi:hypothetical protein